jgi:predicted nucleotidyltransferase
MKINQDIFLALSSQNRKKIAEFFIKRSIAVSEREIGALLNIPSMTTHRILRDFEELNFINISRVGTANVWKVNKNSYAYHMFMQLFYFYDAAASPIKTLKEALRSHLSLKEVKKVILYGSVARGEEKQNSDIDVCILVTTQYAKEKIGPRVDQVSTKCLDLFGNRLEAYVLTEKEYKGLKNRKLVQAIKKGIEVINNECKT